MPVGGDDTRRGAARHPVSGKWHRTCFAQRATKRCAALSISLKVLLADSHPERTAAVERSLGELGYAVIVRMPPGCSIHEAVAAEAPDVVIVDMARPDRDGLDDLRRMTAANPRPIVMFVDRDDRTFMEEAIAAGVCSYNVVGAAFPDVKPIVMAAVAIFRRYRQVEDELARANMSLWERQMIDRAKALLMRRRNIGEPQAYHWLRRKAMNENKRIAAVAAELLEDPKDGGS
jgi:two-component system, response regulator / RNA-binding antiterminator